MKMNNSLHNNYYYRVIKDRNGYNIMCMLHIRTCTVEVIENSFSQFTFPNSNLAFSYSVFCVLLPFILMFVVLFTCSNANSNRVIVHT